MNTKHISHLIASWTTDLERSNCGRLQPSYRYIRKSDRMPTLQTLRDSTAQSPSARVKLFAPEGSMTWYIAAYDPEYRLAWGVIDTGSTFTTGAISMAELVAFRTLRLRLPIERDLHFQPLTNDRLAALWLTKGFRGVSQL